MQRSNRMPIVCTSLIGLRIHSEFAIKVLHTANLECWKNCILNIRVESFPNI